MSDSEDQNKEKDERPTKPPLPKGERFFDPWDAEFRRAYKTDTFDF
ncbi:MULTISPECIES: hypothetical protein [Rhizobium]|jgi:hypothetical protein|nr:MULTISPECIES: hypothetical protein [Rhizobium]MBY2966698.1 hypothetical protein [Rhizobium leguminosarum]MBY2995477.1 hypothetical protein [Rhizobium leguminosarum]MBY3060666.1 hypothetical protein [Rhizobium leguminosarum]